MAPIISELSAAFGFSQYIAMEFRSKIMTGNLGVKSSSILLRILSIPSFTEKFYPQIPQLNLLFLRVIIKCKNMDHLQISPPPSVTATEGGLIGRRATDNIHTIAQQ